MSYEIYCSHNLTFIFYLKLSIRLPEDGAQGEEDDDEGEFNPCAFSDDEEEEHGLDCGCPLCKHGDGGTGEAHEIINKMEV